MNDKIDEAIAAPPKQLMMPVEVTITSTGRTALISVPFDAQDGELAELAGLILTGVLGQCRANRLKSQPPSGIVIARGRVDA